MELLLELAEGSGLHAHIAMFRGEKINRTEDRAVLHVALHLRRLRKVAALEAQAVSP
jgi:glucose-6-phosphate isomerase